LYPDLGIVMTQARGTAADEAAALDAGADDCIAAPFRFRELVARLRAVLQRSPAIPLPRSALLRAGDLDMDPVHRLFRKSGREVHLSPHQFDLLLFLMRHPEMTLTHAKLLRGVWGSTCGRDSGYLRTYVKALRHKIEPDPARPQYILTEPWVGYRFHNPAGANLSLQ
jgi:two-component system KDP operon response regulator KdpE